MKTNPWFILVFVIKSAWTGRISAAFFGVCVWTLLVFSLHFGWAFFRDFKRSGKILFLSILIQSKAQQSTNVVSVLTVSRSVYITIYSISPYSEIIPYLPTMLLMTARRYANPEFPVHHTTSRSECCPTQPEGQVARSELWIGSSWS